MTYALDYGKKRELIISLIHNTYNIHELYHYTILLLTGRYINYIHGTFYILQFIMLLNFYKDSVWETEEEIIDYFLDENNEHFYNNIEYIFNYYRFNNFL